ncbi:MAG: CoA-binding protein [Bacteroidales bacterium]
MLHKPTLVIGVSRNPDRYANMAVRALKMHGHPVYALGREDFLYDDISVHSLWENIPQVHTITLYVKPEHQRSYYQKILNSGARRIIFNPGTWNDELAEMAAQAGIETEDGCTLVMLSSGQF